MEVFSLLKYWKATPPSSAVAQNDTETDADDGPFFDLELAVPDEEEQDDAIQDKNDNDEDNSDSDSEKEFKFTLSPSTSSNDLIFKGNLVLNSSQPNSNSKPQFTASLLKSATKLRVFMLGLKKPKSKPKAEPDNKEPKNPRQRKLFTVKFKVEEVPIVSLFTRDNSSRAKPNTEESESESESKSESESSHTETEIVSSGSDEKRLMRKYLKMVKPLYVRVSRRYAEKVDVSSPESGKVATPPAEDSETAGIANVKAQKQGNVALPAGLRKHLGKGRSAAAAAAAEAAASSKRRDDSLLQQQDWIQGAILHCKRSFNASKDCESSQLPRSVSDPLRETSPELSENSTSEDNDKCL